MNHRNIALSIMAAGSLLVCLVIAFRPHRLGYLGKYAGQSLTLGRNVHDLELINGWEMQRTGIGNGVAYYRRDMSENDRNLLYRDSRAFVLRAPIKAELIEYDSTYAHVRILEGHHHGWDGWIGRSSYQDGQWAGPSSLEDYADRTSGRPN